MAGCGIAHGYPVSTEGSSHAVGFETQPSDQLYSGGSFNAETDSGAGTIEPGNHVSVASSHVQHEDSDDGSSVINPGDETQPEDFPVHSSKHEKPTYLHPLPLLVKQTQKETFEGLSFPSVRYFKRFVESMKNSYLTPGNDLSRYFQTAREVMENEFTSNTHDPTSHHRPDSSKENSDHDETWSESMNSEENKHDDHFPQLSVPNSAPSTAGSSFDENQDSGLNSLAQLAADRPGSKGRGSLEAGNLLQTAAGAQNRETHEVSPRLTEQTPPGLFFGEAAAAAAAQALISPAHGAAPDLDPKSSEGMVQESDSEDSFKYENPSAGFQLGGFQNKDLRKKIPADVLYSPKASPQVGHTNNGNVLGRVPEEPGSLSSSSQTHQSAAGGEDSKGLFRSIVHLPAFGSSASANANLSPRGRRGQAGDQSSRPHVLEYEAFGRRQPLRTQRGEGNTISGINEPKPVSDEVQAFSSGGSDSAHRWISFPYMADLSFLTKLAQPSASDTIFWRKIGHKENSRNSKMKNIIPDDPNVPSSFSAPRKRGATRKGGLVGPPEAAVPHTSTQDTIYWPPHPMYAFKHPKRGARRGYFYQTGDGLSLPFYTTKTRSHYFRSKVSFLKTHYAPH